ncbi:MAG: hypothetical protein HC819_22990 [Cyclobacteriaceae bacterium]|nr:hypothetical protein [Cyclobacteriaceae bacterium]
MRRLLIMIFFSCIAASSFGQLYIQPTVGYTFSTHPRVEQSILIVNQSKTVYKSKLKFGEGVNLGLNLGYSFKYNFFVELHAKKSVYSKFRVSIAQPDLGNLDNYFVVGYFGDMEYESSIFQIAPLVGYQLNKNKFDTYFKIGPNIMKSTINLTQKYIDWEQKNWELYTMNTITQDEFTGDFHIGLQAT